MLQRRFLASALLVVACMGSPAARIQAAPAATPLPRKGLTLSLWAREPMLKNPVALSFDDTGRLYVVETARRSTVDIDIRGHPSWIVDDLANQSIGDLRRFFRTRMAPEKSLENASWLRDDNGDGLHDWRDLTMVKERVHLLQDTRGTGKADRAQVFAEGFNEEVTGVMAGVMPWGPWTGSGRGSDVFVTVYPDLWRLRDTDGDGVADEKESWFHGFGVHAAFDGHDLHGLTVGPEGKIYFSIGDNGFSVTNREGRRLHYPNTGGVLRMNPDGSDLEVFAFGLRNPQEIAFDEFGNMFAVDNDGDLEDERERFVYITEGSDSGWRLHWQFRDAGWAKHTHQPNYNPWIAERMWVPYFSGQPAHITPPLANYSVGPGGFKYNPGTALNDAYRQHFFLVQFPVQKVTAFQVKSRGASFEMVNEHLFLSGMMASAVNFSPDGALFVADWDGLWEPNEKGAIWVVDDPSAVGSPIRTEVKRLLGEGMRHRSAGELVALLGHADMRIRQRAQFELVRRDEHGRLLELARASGAPQLARIHALWGLGQLHRPVAPGQLPFRDVDSEIRAQAAKLAGDLRLVADGPELIHQLQDAVPHVRFHAGLALGKLKVTKATPALIRLLAENNGNDPYLRQAAVMGLAGCAPPTELAALHRSESLAVRLGAVVALRRQASPLVTNFLHDADLLVEQETARAIHDDDSIPAALPALAAWLDRPDLPGSPAVVRRVLNANLRVGTEDTARRLLRRALDSHSSPEWRSEAVAGLAVWNTRPYLDRVEGMVRILSERTPNLGDQLLQKNLEELLGTGIEPVTKTLTELIMQRRLNAAPERFAEWILATNQPASVRAQALELLAQRDAARLPASLTQALASDAVAVRLTALRLLATNSPDKFLEFLEHPPTRSAQLERQTALRLAGVVPNARAAAILGHELDEFLAGRLAPEFALDVLQGCRSRSEAEFRTRLVAYEAGLSTNESLARFRVALAGGNAGVGRDIFQSQANAQCVRCHQAGGESQQAGPVLKGIGKRVTPEYLLEALVDPSRRIAEGFASIRLELLDGDDLDGIQLRQSTDDLTLRLGSGEVRTIPRRLIRRQSTSQISSMPPMGEVLTLDELRDLVAYLQSMK